MKYIMIDRQDENGKTQQVFPIIFPKSLVHADMSVVTINMLKMMWPDSKFETSSAGEVNLFAESTHEESTTLGLISNSGDTQIINYIDYLP